MQEIKQEMYEGLNFEERIELRRKLIAQNGTSLPEQQNDRPMFKEEDSKKNNEKELELENPKIYEGKNFQERLEIRKRLIDKYGTSLPGADQPTPNFGVDDKKGQEDKKKMELSDPKVYEGKGFDDRIEIRRKMIEQFGTSILGDTGKKMAKKGKEEGGRKKTKSKRANFEMRCQKRRIISKIENDKMIDRSKKRAILENKLEFINDPDIIIDEEANICYVSDSKVKERVDYRMIPGIATEIMKGDSYDGSYNGAIARARKLFHKTRRSSKVYYVPWSVSKGAFRTSLLDESKKVKSIISNRGFFPVSYFLAFLTVTFFRSTRECTTAGITTLTNTTQEGITSVSSSCSPSSYSG